MYNRFQLIKKYLRYYFTASSGKGHGVHSPFVFGFIENVLRDKKIYDCYHEIETRRSRLLQDQQVIELEDLGAGSTQIKSNKRMVADIARSSLKSKKFGQLLYRIVQYYQPVNMIELGTSLGITTAYLAAGNAKAKLITCEGAPAIAAIARQGFRELGLPNIELLEGDFAATLPTLLSRIGQVDLAFIDGNHRKQPTLEYFDRLSAVSTSSTILIFDDIHWSKEMEEAWEEIKKNPQVTLTIDLFFIGLVFFNADCKIKQDFSIRF